MSGDGHSVFFGDCDTPEKALERFAQFTGCMVAATEMFMAYEEITEDCPGAALRFRISTWVN